MDYKVKLRKPFQFEGETYTEIDLSSVQKEFVELRDRFNLPYHFPFEK